MPGRKLGRKTDHRLSMLRGQVTFLLEKGRLETTATRAKEVQSLAEKMITLGKKNTLAARRQAAAYLRNVTTKDGKNAVQVCVSNALTLGIMAVIRVAFSVISVFLQTFYFFVLEESLPTKLSNFFSLATNLVGIIVFIFFVINMFYLMSKKHTPLFGNTAKKFAEREE